MYTHDKKLVLTLKLHLYMYSLSVSLSVSTRSSSSQVLHVHIHLLPSADSGMLVAPPVQYVRHGAEQFRLNCSYPGANIEWGKVGSSEAVTGLLESPSFNDEGLYECEILVIDVPRRIQARITQTIRLYVFGE